MPYHNPKEASRARLARGAPPLRVGIAPEPQPGRKPPKPTPKQAPRIPAAAGTTPAPGAAVGAAKPRSRRRAYA